MSSFASGLMGGFSDTALKKRQAKAGSSGNQKSSLVKRFIGKLTRGKAPKVGNLPTSTRQVPDFVGSYKRGGKIRKTGMAKVHRGERVLSKRQAKRYARAKGR
jgi:hypothetical protein